MSLPLLSTQSSHHYEDERQTQHLNQPGSCDVSLYEVWLITKTACRVYSSPLRSHVNELCVLKLLLWWRYTESSVILCSACQHASLTVLVLFRYSCYISHVLSLGPIPSFKKKYHLHKKDYVLSKKKQQTLWHKNMVHRPLQSRRWKHAHTYCTLSCQQHSFHPPMGESFFSDGGWRFSAWAGQHRHVSDLRCKWLGRVSSQAVHLSSHCPSGEQAGWRQDAGQQVDLWTALMKPRKSLRWSSPRLALIPPLPVIFKRTDDGTQIEMIWVFFFLESYHECVVCIRSS